MKSPALYIILVLFAFQVSGQTANDSTWSIGPGYISNISVNMAVSKLNNYFAEKQIEKKTKGELEFITIWDKDGKEKLFEIETMCVDICIVSRVYCYSPKYLTKKGVGVGDAFGKLKTQHSVSRIIGGDKVLMVFVDDLPQTVFIVKVPKLKVVADKYYEASDIPEDTKIEKIYMY